MKNRKKILIGLGALTFLALMVINVQLVQSPVGADGVDLSLVELTASAAIEGSEGGGGFGGSLLSFLLDLWYNLLNIVFGGGDK
ncbi:MAG TPA: hypothetical protein VKZ56_07230 [Membranihabitans sp.]|nr:hypothetical protein [Membranihabitans sp.]